MKDDLDRLIDEIEAERPGFRAKYEAAYAARVAAVRARGRGLSVRDAAALLGVTPAGLKLHDARLQPTRDSSGRRTYDRASVAALAAERKSAVRKSAERKSAERKAARSRRRRAS